MNVYIYFETKIDAVDSYNAQVNPIKSSSSRLSAQVPFCLFYLFLRLVFFFFFFSQLTFFIIFTILLFFFPPCARLVLSVCRLTSFTWKLQKYPCGNLKSMKCTKKKSVIFNFDNTTPVTYFSDYFPFCI